MNETKSQELLQVAAPLVRLELMRFHLPDRCRTLANLILMLSWDVGLASARSACSSSCFCWVMGGKQQRD